MGGLLVLVSRLFMIKYFNLWPDILLLLNKDNNRFLDDVYRICSRNCGWFWLAWLWCNMHHYFIEFWIVTTYCNGKVFILAESFTSMVQEVLAITN